MNHERVRVRQYLPIQNEPCDLRPGVVPQLAQQLSDANASLARQDELIRRLTQQIAYLEYSLTVGPGHNSGAAAADPTVPDSDKPAAPSTDVDRVIDQLDKRLVSDTDRGRLHKSLDRADKPLGGRAGADEALGRAIRWRRDE